MISKLPQVAQVNNTARVDICHLKYASSFLYPAFQNLQILCNPEGLVVGLSRPWWLIKTYSHAKRICRLTKTARPQEKLIITLSWCWQASFKHLCVICRSVLMAFPFSKNVRYMSSGTHATWEKMIFLLGLSFVLWGRVVTSLNGLDPLRPVVFPYRKHCQTFPIIFRSCKLFLVGRTIMETGGCTGLWTLLYKLSLWNLTHVDKDPWTICM